MKIVKTFSVECTLNNNCPRAIEDQDTVTSNPLLTAGNLIKKYHTYTSSLYNRSTACGITYTLVMPFTDINDADDFEKWLNEKSITYTIF